MRPFMRAALAVAMLASFWAPGAGIAAAQPAAGVDPALRQRVEQQFEILPVQDGVVLRPRRSVPGVRTIEVRRGLIAVDGVTVTGAQLRERIGDRAELVLQLSYLTPDTVERWTDEPDAPQPAAPPERPEAPKPEERPESREVPQLPEPPVVPEEAEVPDVPEPPERDDRRWRRSGAKVHIGSSVVVEEDEQVTEPVVAVGGSVTVLGRVDDDVVAVLGSVRLGPKAEVRGDVTAVGGRVRQEPGAHVGGTVNEVRVGSPNFRFDPGGMFHGVAGWHVFDGWVEMVWTLFRIGLVVLLAFLVLLVAPGAVDRISERAWREPWMAGFIGLLAQLLFVPILVFTVIVLAISIIGIPLLVLVPFGVLLFLVAMLVGYTGVAYRIGRWAVGGLRSPFLALAVGVVLIAALGVLARTVDLLPVPVWPVTWVLGLAGFLIEYVAWTVGLGAALLTRFGTRGPGTPPVGGPMVGGSPPVGGPPVYAPPPVPGTGTSGV